MANKHQNPLLDPLALLGSDDHEEGICQLEEVIDGLLAEERYDIFDDAVDQIRAEVKLFPEMAEEYLVSEFAKAQTGTNRGWNVLFLNVTVTFDAPRGGGMVSKNALAFNRPVEASLWRRHLANDDANPLLVVPEGLIEAMSLAPLESAAACAAYYRKVTEQCDRLPESRRRSPLTSLALRSGCQEIGRASP